MWWTSTTTHPLCLSWRMIPSPQHLKLTFVLVWAKGQGLWLIIKPFIHSFRITYSIFTLVLHFRFGLIQPSTSSFFTCECGHMLNASGMHFGRCSFGGQRITTHDVIRDVMYTLTQKSGHAIWKKWWYALTSRFSLWTNLYMTQKDHVFVVDVVVINPMWETMVSSAINQPTCVIAKFSTIVTLLQNAS
jgi:hypothetical protein